MERQTDYDNTANRNKFLNRSTFFYIDTIIQGLILVHILPFIQNQ